MNPNEWPRIKELFHAALERAPAERRAFLDAACDGEELLRAEIERLLAAHSEAGTFIEESPVVALSAAESVGPITGRVMGHYHVGRLLGTGGMGAVYAAHDVELGRVVALKMVTGNDLEAQGRLRREAQRASQLNHPHICTIHEVGASEGQAYFAMEYVEGQTLSQLIARRPLSMEGVLRYGTQIADALAHAHQHGVIHRDLKSANVMVTSDSRVKVLDFGLACGVPAHRLQEASQSKASLAEEGPIAGTLPYMAPELLRGEPAGVHSDIWALGVILYEMATAQHPFDGATGLELSAGILHQPPAPFPNQVPGSLQGVVRRCLAKDPRERYQLAIEVRSALESQQAGAATAPQPIPLLRGLKNAFRSRSAALALIVLLVIAGGLATYWQSGTLDRSPAAIGPSGRPAVAVMSFDNMAGTQDTAWLSKGVPSMLLTGLAQTRGLEIVSAQRLHEALKQLGHTSLESLDQAQVADVARRAGAGAVVVGSIVRSGTELRIDAQLEDLSSGRVLLAETVRGTDVFTLIDQLAARIRERVGFSNVMGVRRIADVSSSSVDAYRLYSQGVEASINARADDAQKLLDQAVVIDPGFAEAHLELAFLHRLFGREGRWRDSLRNATAHSERLNERQRLLLEVEWARQSGNASVAARLIDELIAKFPDADEVYNSAFQLYGPFGPLNDFGKSLKILAGGVAARPLSMMVRNTYGYGLLEAGRYGEAIREFEVAVQGIPHEPNPLDSLAEAYLTIGVPDKAIEYYSRALTVDPRFSNARGGRAWALAMLGRYDEAIAEDPSDPSIKAFTLSRAGRHADAATIIGAGLREARVNKSFSAQGSLSLLLSLFALEQRQYARARQELRASKEYFAQMSAQEQRPYLVLVDAMAGMVEVAASRPDDAKAHLDALKRRYNPALVTENWWSKALEGEIALAEGRLEQAVDAYRAGEPSGRMWLNMLLPGVSILANNFPGRDGVARVEKARGNHAGAIEGYRRLISVTRQKWSAMVEPRHILEIARLLDQAGDRDAAALEYRRFLDLWSHADAGLPELTEARRAVARIRQGASATGSVPDRIK